MVRVETVRNFKDIFDVNRAVDYIFAILKYSGHHPFEEKSKPRGVYLFYCVIVYGIMMICETVQLIIAFGDIDKMADTLFIYITHLGSFYKTYNMYTKSPAICKLIKELGVCHSEQINNRRQKIVKEATKSFGKLVFGYYACAFFAWFLMVLAPLAQGGEALPLVAWYPINQTKSGWYQAIYVQQAFCTFVVCAVTLSVDCVLVFLMQQMGMQLDLLREEFMYINEEVKKIANGQCEECIENKMRNRLLAKAIVHHQNLIRYRYKFIQCVPLMGSSFVASLLFIHNVYFSLHFTSLFCLN